MQKVRDRHEREAKERERLAEIERLEKEQKIDDKSNKIHGPGKYMKDAPKGKGQITTGQLDLDRIEGWAQINDLYGLDAPTLDRLSEDEFMEAMSKAFRENPSLLAILGHLSVTEIRAKLHDLMSGHNPEQGHQGKVRPEGADSQIEPEDIPVRLNERGGFASYEPEVTAFNVKLSEAEYTEINDCLRSLRENEDLCSWVEDKDEDGHVSGHYVCQLCGRNLAVISAWLIGGHFVQEHTKEARRFFKDRGVPFRKGYLGVLNGKKPKKK
jgi:hypothetical protein